MDKTCDLKFQSKGTWERIPLSQALTLAKGREMRCQECHGQVRPFVTGKNGEVAHFEHAERNPGCSLGDCFDGSKRMHLKAMT